MYIFAAILMSSIASTYGMNRLAQSIRSVANNVKTNVKATINKINTYPNQDCPRTFVPFTGKASTQAKLDAMRANAKNGTMPSTKDINELMRYSEMNNYGILNQQDSEGHTFLHDVLKNGDYSPKHRYIIKGLYAQDAKLNDRDKYAMGPESLLKTYLGLPLNASASTTIKVLRTFYTKNTSEKLERKLLTMTEHQGEQLLKKSLDINETYATIKPSLDALCMQQRADAKNKRRNME